MDRSPCRNQILIRELVAQGYSSLGTTQTSVGLEVDVYVATWGIYCAFQGGTHRTSFGDGGDEAQLRQGSVSFGSFWYPFNEAGVSLGPAGGLLIQKLELAGCDDRDLCPSHRYAYAADLALRAQVVFGSPDVPRFVVGASFGYRLELGSSSWKGGLGANDPDVDVSGAQGRIGIGIWMPAHWPYVSPEPTQH